MKWTSKRVLAGIAAALAVATGGGAAFAAQESDDADPPGPGAILAGVAERLGIPEAELKDAVRAEALERLDAAVAAGRLTEEQEARIRERIESGQPLRHRLHRHAAPFVEAAAEYLGVTPAELFDELRGGKSLARIAEAHGKTAAGLEQALLDEAADRTHDLVNRTGPLLPEAPSDAP